MTLGLTRHHRFAPVDGPVLVVVMDGVGIGAPDEGNAVWLARTPNLDWLAANSPTTALKAHGRAVGMPSDQDMGNSEVGHNVLGSGRVFEQGASLVKTAIETGALFRGETWLAAIAQTHATHEPIHFIGLLSDGNVHSHIDHLIGLLRGARQEGVMRARVHVLLDGRDVPRRSALEYVDALERELTELNTGAGVDFRIASGGGRMSITMDRYNANWPMVERGYRTHVFGEARHFMSTRTAIETLREEREDMGDQDLPPFAIVDEHGQYVGPIRDGAAVILFNFRGDRAIEISRTFEDETFTAFDRSPRPNVLFAGMMQYDGDLKIPGRFLVEPPEIDHTFGEILAANDVTQLACSETQKYGHVTYFWNGNRSGKFSEKLETYIEIPSDILPFEERPWMKSAEITDAVIRELRKNQPRFGRINFANGDMVGHTGFRDATVQAVEAVDLQIGRLMQAVRELHGALIVTADHGNADEMFERDASGAWVRDAHSSVVAKTSHTLNAVPLHLFAPGRQTDAGLVFRDAEPSTRTLAAVAATAIELMGYEAPPDYWPSLLRR